MTINQIADAINARAAAETGSNAAVFTNDFAGRYDISNDEAERIAAASDSLDAFDKIWQNDTWWTDAAN